MSARDVADPRDDVHLHRFVGVQEHCLPDADDWIEHWACRVRERGLVA